MFHLTYIFCNFNSAAFMIKKYIRPKSCLGTFYFMKNTSLFVCPAASLNSFISNYHIQTYTAAEWKPNSFKVM